MNNPQTTAALVQAEVFRAEMVHPHWPSDIIHQAAIVAEESCELVRAAVNIEYENADISAAITEATHTAATACRMLDALITLQKELNQ